MVKLLKSTDLSIGYDRPLQKGLSFFLEEGDFLFLKGPNGSGKTTLLKTLMGEIPILEGDLEYLKTNLQMEFLPQTTKGELPLSITLEEILLSYHQELTEFSFLGEAYFKKKWIEASGGEQQKTLILCKIQKQCDILFLDEPFNHVDSKGIQDILELLKQLLTEKKIGSLVMISHIEPSLDNYPQLKVLELS